MAKYGHNIEEKKKKAFVWLLENQLTESFILPLCVYFNAFPTFGDGNGRQHEKWGQALVWYA